MPTDTRTSELVLNVLSKQDYDNIPNPDPNQLYLVPEEEKANVDADNFTSVGTTYLSSLGMPSSRYESVSVLSSGGIYTAPANGLFNFTIKLNTGTGNSAYGGLLDNNDDIIYYVREYGVLTGYTITWLYQVKAGNRIRLHYESTNSSPTPTLIFIYAEGNPTPSNP